MGPPVSFRDEIGTRFVVEKFRDVVSENELEIADGTVALLGEQFIHWIGDGYSTPRL
jgi:hypothetical protein